MLNLVQDRQDWLGHALRGELAMLRAWIARGHGFAKTVSDEQWAIHNDQMQVARTEFTKAWEKNPRHPETAVGLLITSLVVSDLKEAEAWFTEAIRAEFDFEPAYLTMLNYLRPRWHGTHQEMADFGVACADTARFDTIVPSLCVRTLAMIHEDADPEFAARYGTADWRQRVQSVVDGYVRSMAKDAVWLARVKTDQACYLWSLGDRDAALKLLRELPKESIFWPRLMKWQIGRKDMLDALDASPQGPAPEF